MIKPKAIILSGYGLNCEDETKYAFELAGSTGKVVHINDLIKNKNQLNDYQIMAIPGGFAYGDDTGSGNAYALKLKNHLWEQILKFVQKDNLVIGICNGFQVLVNLGLLPALDQKYGERQVTLLPNVSTRYTVRWVDIKTTNDTPWLLNIDEISLPIAHGEGKFFAKDEVLKELNKKNLISAKYIKGEICEYQSLEANPTGTLENIASITDVSKRIFGLMPHPERAMFFTQLPNWPIKKEKYLREGKELPKFGPGLQIFKNGVNYFK